MQKTWELTVIISLQICIRSLYRLPQHYRLHFGYDEISKFWSPCNLRLLKELKLRTKLDLHYKKILNLQFRKLKRRQSWIERFWVELYVILTEYLTLFKIIVYVVKSLKIYLQVYLRFRGSPLTSPGVTPLTNLTYGQHRYHDSLGIEGVLFSILWYKVPPKRYN